MHIAAARGLWVLYSQKSPYLTYQRKKGTVQINHTSVKKIERILGKRKDIKYAPSTSNTNCGNATPEYKTKSKGEISKSEFHPSAVVRYMQGKPGKKKTNRRMGNSKGKTNDKWKHSRNR